MDGPEYEAGEWRYLCSGLPEIELGIVRTHQEIHS